MSSTTKRSRGIWRILSAILAAVALPVCSYAEAPRPMPTETPISSETPAPAPTESPVPSEVPSPMPTVYPTLALGMEGADVLRLQTRLAELEYLIYEEGVLPDGIYDEATQDAVIRFQTFMAFEPTGIADDAIQQLIFDPMAPVYDPAATPMPSPTPLPTIPAGWKPAKWPRRGFGGGMPAAAGMIPGVPLNSSHISGHGDMSVYGAIDPESIEGAAHTAITSGSAEFLIELCGADGRPLEFKATCGGDALTLTAGEALPAGTAWHVNGYVLKALAKGGIQRLTLIAGESRIEINADAAITGTEYANLRANGMVSHDFNYTLPLNGIENAFVNVSGRTYAISGSGNEITLIPAEGRQDGCK